MTDGYPRPEQGRTFRCEHMSASNLHGLSCGVCGDLQPIPNTTVVQTVPLLIGGTE